MRGLDGAGRKPIKGTLSPDTAIGTLDSVPLGSLRDIPHTWPTEG